MKNSRNMNRYILQRYIVLLCIVLMWTTVGFATTTYNVSINTTGLIAHPAGPFTIVAVLTDGSQTSDGNSTVTLSNFDFGGGSSFPNPAQSGGANGNLNSTVSLTDSSFLNVFTQSFSPGNSLTFTLAISATDEDGPIHDGVSIYILDSAGIPLPTQSLGANFLINIDLNPDGLLIETFGTDLNRSPSTGNPIAIVAPSVLPRVAIVPVTIAALTPTPNAAGWNNSNVTVTLNSADDPGGTGVKQISYSATGAQSIASTTVPAATTSFQVSNEGITTIAFFGTDNTGNVETPKTLTVELDKTPPSITGSRTPLPNANGWNNTDVTVSFACADTLSGLLAGSPQPTVLSTEGANQSVSGECQDLAGNSSSITVSGVNIDKTPPIVSCSVSPNVLWPPNNKLVPVNAYVTVTDSLSGSAGFTLVSITSSEPDSGLGDIQGFMPGTPSVSGELRAQRHGPGNGRVYTLTYSGLDRAGNAATCTTTVTVPHDQGIDIDREKARDWVGDQGGAVQTLSTTIIH